MSHPFPLWTFATYNLKSMPLLLFAKSASNLCCDCGNYSIVWSRSHKLGHIVTRAFRVLLMTAIMYDIL